jgi:2'-5' RNA ligase
MAATAIVVPVPQAEAAVGRWRRRHTPSGSGEMAAHVTLLYPFVDEAALDERHDGELRSTFGRFPPFDFLLTALEEFPPSGETAAVLYLAPEPSGPFVAMTEALLAAFPGLAPYGGRHRGVVPHLTLASLPDAPLATIRDEIRGVLPIGCRAEEAWVMAERDGRWRRRSTVPFGPPRSP